MSRDGIELAVIFFALTFAATTAWPQESGDFGVETQLETYLGDRGLDRVLGARLRSRLRTAEGDERVRIAESLARVYARQLEAAVDHEARQNIERLCKNLIESVPDVESFGLRIELARTLYLTVESDAEGSRMLMSSPERDAETIRVLKSVAPQFTQLARRLQNECERLQRRVDAADDADADSLRVRLESYRGFRSRAAYYAGWSSYYLAMLEKESKYAVDALESFGIILGAVPGNQANLERINKGFMRFPHYARSMVGCAMAASLLGRDVEALRWLDAVSNSSETPPEVESQLFVRYAVVLAESQRWTDLDVRTRTHRARADSASGRLSKAEARLLAVLALQSSSIPGGLPRTREITEELAQIALSDLVASGDVAHVKDLFRRFGTVPIAESGFVALYLRGADSFEKARELHLQAGGESFEPVQDPQVIAGYRSAAELLRGAIESADAGNYETERSRAMVRRGLALFFAGDIAEAADELERGSTQAFVEEDRRESLWFGIVALDRLIRMGRTTLQERCDRLAAEYVRRYPGTERSVSLLSRLVNSGMLDGDAAIQSLVDVAPDSAIYLTARSEAVSRLYQKFSKASAQERDIIALRVAELGEEVMKRYHEISLTNDAESAKNAAERLIVRGRQVVDCLLSMSSPETGRAASVLTLITSTADRIGLDMTVLEPEICYHRFRLARATGDDSEEQRASSRLMTLATKNPDAVKFLEATDSIKLSEAWERFRTGNADVESARRIVNLVQSMIARHNGALSDRMHGVYAKGAEAAHQCWVSTDDAPMLELAVEWDEKLIRSVRNVSSIRRLAIAYEHLGRDAQALALWNELLNGTPERQDAWYEARIGSIRLLLKINPREAADAMRQHRVLYPDPGPEPWKSRLIELQMRCDQFESSSGGPPR